MQPDESIRTWKLARSGDREALAELLRQNQDMIYRFSVSRLGDSQLAYDATQETAARVITGLSRLELGGRFSTWVLGIANNVCREIRRKRKRWQQPEDYPLEPGSESQGDPLIAEETKEILLSSVEQLADRQREAILLRYFEELSLAETAEIMEISVGTVKATINQALKRLKSLVIDS